ncbi:putative zinc-binding metallopeptidase [Rapidithrix thailandica]|uniref:Zinc-binding metallopeptidase n=1 Tax=Rapidithrix thailandica TaxID=413964 RepID=A0AAW9SHQ5_9BACT
MINKKFMLLLGSLMLIWASCEDPYNDELNLDQLNFGESLPKTELDNWLYENFTSPYNIEVKYRWDASETDVDYTLVPPKPEKVTEVMTLVKEAWIAPYMKIAGAGFFNSYSPKQFVLLGSAKYNPGGTITLGTAEGGRKVVLYVVNDFDLGSREHIKHVMHTVHHEFAHILHQNILYPSEFKLITPGDYSSSDWDEFSDAEARRMGFITNYAMASPDEDFVEMLSTMLVEGHCGYENILSAIQVRGSDGEVDEEATNKAVENIRKKEQIVINYLKETYNIDFEDLQTEVQASMDQLAPPYTLLDQWGSDKAYSTVRLSPELVNGLPDAFLAMYNEAKENLKNDTGLDLVYMELIYDSENQILLHLPIKDSGGTVYNALFAYKPETDENGKLTFVYQGSNGNGNFISGMVKALTDHLENNAFVVEWYHPANNPCAQYPGFFPEGNPEAYFFGNLHN